jgi:DivIVA domain-containing protein
VLLRRSSENVPVPAVRPEVSPLPLTPADVHNVVFKKPPIGKRGYDEDEVDAFLDVVEAELSRLIEENNELRAGGRSVAQERPEPAPAPAPVVAAPPPAVAAPREDDSARASRMLALATETADRYVNEAKTQAEQMISSAKNTSDRLLNDARTKSEQMVSEAKHRADTTLGDARTRAETMEREARAKAAALDQDAERRHAEAVTGLEEKRASLERKIDELRTFEREYRTRLRSYLESHLRDLDSRGSAEPAQNARQNQHAPA